MWSTCVWSKTVMKTDNQKINVKLTEVHQTGTVRLNIVFHLGSLYSKENGMKGRLPTFKVDFAKIK